MNLSLCVFICGILVPSFTFTVAGQNVNSKNNAPKKQVQEELPIDDEDAEGSGFSNVDESSGSGSGPYDEDSEHESFTNVNGKPDKQSGILRTLPNPSTTTKSVSTSPPSILRPNSEYPKIFDVNYRPKPVDVLNENEDIVTPHKSDVSNNNPKLAENENQDHELIQPKRLPDEESNFDNNRHPDDKIPIDEDSRTENNGVYRTNTPDRDRATSFFAQPGILAAVIGGAVVGLLCAILVVMFIVYRMRKKDEGSYPLEEMKRCPANNPYMKPNHREFFA